MTDGAATTATGARPEFVTLDEFVAVDEPGAEPLAASPGGGTVIPAGGLVMVYGNGGAGKTTLLVDACFHLAAGVAWLGVTPTRPLTVLWIENEGPRPEFRKKLRAKLAAWDGPHVGATFHVHESPWGAFDFRSAEQRDALVQRIHDTDADIVVAGPVKAIGMTGGGTDDDIGGFLACIGDVQDDAAAAGRRPTFLLVHHENRAGQISGAWESRPDTLIHVQAQGHGRTRAFWQKCRWSSELHGTAWPLLWRDREGFELEAKPDVTDDTIADEILAAVRANPGASWRTVRDAVTGSATDCARVRDTLLAAGRLVNHAARSGYFNLWHPDDPASGSEPGTTLEPPLVPLADDGTERSGSAVPAIKGTAERTAPLPGPASREDDDLERLADLGRELGLA